MYDVGVDSFARTEINDKKLSIKDIPYLRYKFINGAINEEQIEYIRKSQEKFPHSVHIIDVKLDEYAKGTIDTITEKFGTYKNGKVAILLDIPVKAGDIASEMLNDEKKSLIEQNISESVYRYILCDEDMEIVDNMRLDGILGWIIKTLKIKADRIGLCNAPIMASSSKYGIHNLKGTLPASVVRDLQLYVNTDFEVPLVTEGHESRDNLSGCTAYYEVNDNIVSHETRKVPGGGVKKVSGIGDKAPKEPKAPKKKSGPPNIF